jgi:hypothetical protein
MKKLPVILKQKRGEMPGRLELALRKDSAQAS